MHLLSRRHFLKGSALSLALVATGNLTLDALRARPAHAAENAHEFLLLSDTFEKNPHAGAKVAVTQPGSLNVFDVTADEAYKIDLPFFGHSYDQDPKNPTHVATFEKWGRRGALIDFKSREIVTLAEPTKDNVFFGHSTHAQGGEVIVAPEETYERTGGMLVLRDPKTLKFLDKFPSYGVMPHQCTTVDNGKTLVVVNQGRGKITPNISWVELSSGKLLKKSNLFPRPAFAHLDISHDGWVVTGGRYKKDRDIGSRVALVSPDGKAMRLRAPEKLEPQMWDEALSVAFIGNTGLVGATYREAGYVAVWNYHTQQFVNAIKLHYPTGIIGGLNQTPEKQVILVSSHDDRNLIELNLEAGLPTMSEKIASAKFGGAGSHLTRAYA